MCCFCASSTRLRAAVERLVPSLLRLFLNIPIRLSKYLVLVFCFFFFSSRRRHTRWTGDWSSDVCSSDLAESHLGRHDHVTGPWRGDRSLTRPGPRTRPLRWDSSQPSEVTGMSRRTRIVRSEERRVGKEGRSRWWPDH